MRVKPSQLIPGCILLQEVKGKSNKPLVPKNTVLEEKHITFLGKFLISSVEVSSKLADGKVFQPKEIIEGVSVNREHKKEKQHENLSFKNHYDHAVHMYKKEFEKWQNGMPVDMAVLRKHILPLLERINEIEEEVYLLHRYSKRKDYFYYHSVALGVLSAYLGKKMGFKKGEWLQIGIAGLLSDSGMAKLDPAILLKEHPLTMDELNEIKKHPAYAYRLVENTPTITQGVKIAVLQHHERLDGSGYPLGLRKGRIHRFARIIALCDMYNQMTSEHSCKEKKSPYKAIEALQKEKYTKLDPEVVNAFIDSLVRFSIGTKVKLSNQFTGEIVFIDHDEPARPIVRLQDGQILSLQQEQSIFIEEVIG